MGEGGAKGFFAGGGAIGEGGFRRFETGLLEMLRPLDPGKAGEIRVARVEVDQ